jgi:hypothetical protein
MNFLLEGGKQQKTLRNADVLAEIQTEHLRSTKLECHLHSYFLIEKCYVPNYVLICGFLTTLSVAQST